MHELKNISRAVDKAVSELGFTRDEVIERLDGNKRERTDLESLLVKIDSLIHQRTGTE